MHQLPVFYEKSQAGKRPSPYPEVFYRSNYRGAVMYMDEPAIRLGGELIQIHALSDPAAASNLLRLWALGVYAGQGTYGSGRLHRELTQRGANLGVMRIVERDIPIWETTYQTAFYQLQACASGMVHEGRYQLDQFNSEVAAILGPGIELSVEEMMLLHIAFLRGAARTFSKDWGISVYGQADPQISPKAIAMAYDMGARYIWFWTSDGGHHVPFVEQLELARTLSDHARRHPRSPRHQLIRRATVAIVLPEGYTVQPHALWGHPSFRLDKPNSLGTPYGEVVGAALYEAICCLRKGESFDFLVESRELDALDRCGYQELIRIGRDGKRY